MIQRILFATDFSSISERAESYVVQIAKPLAARVIVLHAIEPIAGISENDPQFAPFLTGLRDKAQARARGLIERLAGQGVDAELHIEIDKRWHAIERVAREQDVDLIAMGSHAVQEGGKVYIGTTSHKVFFSTDKPLLIVPQG